LWENVFAAIRTEIGEAWKPRRPTAPPVPLAPLWFFENVFLRSVTLAVDVEDVYTLTAPEPELPTDVLSETWLPCISRFMPASPEPQMHSTPPQPRSSSPFGESSLFPLRVALVMLASTPPSLPFR
jgi:hypothetical protein